MDFSYMGVSLFYSLSFVVGIQSNYSSYFLKSEIFVILTSQVH